MPERFLQASISLVIGSAFLITLVNFRIALDGPKHCTEKFERAQPQLAKQSMVVERIWTRAQKDHWLSALLVQPLDIQAIPLTVVCHFSGTNFAPGTVEVFSGDRIEKLKQVSVSILVPTTWFR